MKKILLVLIPLVVIVTIAILFLVLRASDVQPPPETPPSQFPSIPNDPALGNAKTLSLNGGGTIVVRDFLESSATTADPVNPGHYFIGNYVDPTREDAAVPRYVIEFIDSTGYFSISLLQEPIGEVRQDAERFLQQQLNLPHEDMCRLKYMISVPNRINQSYAGYDLRFSFCPGAIPLAS